jgi:hypothetical protein
VSRSTAPARRFSLPRALLGFVLGLVLGWVGAVIAWLAWVEATGFVDREGAGAMGAVFVMGPAIGLTTAFVMAVWLGRRVQRAG